MVGTVLEQQPSGGGTVAERLSIARDGVRAAAEDAGRDPASVRILLATKTVPPPLIREAFAAGETLIGENRVQEVLRSLAPREREVIELRFGLKDGTPRTLDEVARQYGITRERIRQIEARGLLKLRQPTRATRLEEFADADEE